MIVQNGLSRIPHPGNTPTGPAVYPDHFHTRIIDSGRQLDEHYSELKSAARGRLGSLVNPADYPESLEPLAPLPPRVPPALHRRHKTQRCRVQHRVSDRHKMWAKAANEPVRLPRNTGYLVRIARWMSTDDVSF